jgi:hypothetical protein
MDALLGGVTKMKILISGIILALLCIMMRLLKKLLSIVDDHDDILNSDD